VSDQLFGFVLVGVAIIVVLGIVFAVSSRLGGTSAAEKTPPRGVHMPAPSILPAVIALAAVLIGAGLAFHGDYYPANPWIIIPGLVLFIGAAVAWVRSAGHEWREVEQGSHDDGAAH
jgi:hypothetical protein